MRIQLGEVWLSVPCGTFSKLGVITGEHQFRDKGDRQRKPIQGTEKGEKAEEDDALVQKALQLVEFLARRKAEQLQTGEMMEVEGIKIDLSGMEWFMENPVGMLAMQAYMQQFIVEFEYDLVSLIMTIDYCAWGHYYQKPTHIWTSMVFWVPRGTQ